MAAACTHLDTIQVTELPPAVAGCEDCLREGSPWCHLRMCLTCGHIGCCDSSPRRHASQHARSAIHPLIRSLQPSEEWSWCYADQLVLEIPAIHGATALPPSPLGCP
jgi:uncharacterized UBP type Zn finger protein